MAHSIKWGSFCCDSCKHHFTEAFPFGYCPDCGIHEGGRDGEQDEFCGKHWDIHRAKNGYEASQEENHKDVEEDDGHPKDDIPF